MDIRALNGNVFVEPEEKVTESDGGIIFPDTVHQETRIGKVVAAQADSVVLAGDNVVFPAYTLQEMSVGKEKHYYVYIEDIICKF